MPQVTEAYEWRGRNVVTSDGDKIGRLEEIYLDTDTGQPQWATVRTGLFGAQHSFVPLAQVDHRRGEVVVPYTRDHVRDAPSINPEGQLSHDEEDRLYSHYSLGSEEPAGRDVSGPQALDGPEISAMSARPARKVAKPGLAAGRGAGATAMH
jgi:sporulation protein YlmC with PRC-barrel domain